MCIEIVGTKSKKLIEYINRASDYLELYNTEALFILEVHKNCASNAGGYCNGDQDSVLIEIAREDAQGKIHLDDMKINIAHELVHAKQISEGRLVNLGFVLKGNALIYCWEWKGREYTEIAYEDQPWEIEAYALEKEVYEACR
jgi:hypothetical protein